MSKKHIMPERKFFKLKIENGKLKIAVGGVPPQSIREDTRIKELHQMPEYGIDAILLYMKVIGENRCYTTVTTAIST